MLIILLFVMGCQSRQTVTGILSKEDYTEYLVNVYVAEAKLNTYVITPDSAIKLFQPFDQSLLRKLNTNDSVIQKTHQYYLAHPAELQKIYTAVIDTLTMREGRIGRPSK